MTNRGDEQKVTEAFGAWLVANDWTVQYEVDWLDILAERSGERLYVEAKGRTSSPGLDVDTAFGQLLRRMPTIDDQLNTFALVVRDEPRSVRAAVRVPLRIRHTLRIAVYAVSDDGAVRELDGPTG